ncbi:MAG: hypothetical protein EXR72_15615 [Myxococcales bacterium]|nr:hypothetical protein [Myxococcales bacterium]
MARFDELEQRVTELTQKLGVEFKDLGDDLRWSITRALIHRAVHYAAERPGVEYCTLATYLGDMVGHAHRLAHGDNPKAPTHNDLKH